MLNYQYLYYITASYNIIKYTYHFKNVYDFKGREQTNDEKIESILFQSIESKL